MGRCLPGFAGGGSAREAEIAVQIGFHVDAFGFLGAECDGALLVLDSFPMAAVFEESAGVSVEYNGVVLARQLEGTLSGSERQGPVAVFSVAVGKDAPGEEVKGIGVVGGGI